MRLYIQGPSPVLTPGHLMLLQHQYQQQQQHPGTNPYLHRFLQNGGSSSSPFSAGPPPHPPNLAALFNGGPGRSPPPPPRAGPFSPPPSLLGVSPDDEDEEADPNSRNGSAQANIEIVNGIRQEDNGAESGGKAHTTFNNFERIFQPFSVTISKQLI